MKIIDKILAKQNSLHENRQPVIAFLGDSVTQGCFEIYVEQGQLLTAFRAEDGYVTKVKTLLGMLYPAVPVSIINAGISGQNAELGLERLERDVLSYQPDLVVVCFGLNDATEDAEMFAKMFEEAFNIKPEIRMIGPIIGAHLGPNAVALTFLANESRKY